MLADRRPRLVQRKRQMGRAAERMHGQIGSLRYEEERNHDGCPLFHFVTAGRSETCA